MKLTIGKTYTFDYESSSKQKKVVEKIKISMTEELKKFIIEKINLNKETNEKLFKAMSKVAKEIVNCKDLDLKEELKRGFYEQFSGKSKDEKSDIENASNVFFRNYNPENITINKNGTITAIFAGYSVTVNNIITYKWYVLSNITVEPKKLTEEVVRYIEEV
jgi:hypothetical protein